MRYIFARHDRAFQINRIKEGLQQYRTEGALNPAAFQMHEAYDDLCRQVAENFLGHWSHEVAVVGLGGYGRKEMSPYSDIDLLFLRPEDAPEGVYRAIRNILYLLWDARVELGHSVRTVDECRQEADKDLAVLTSLMDVRLVWGNPLIFRNLLIQREKLLQEADPLDLYLRIEAEALKSTEKFAHTIYLLEPHLKEGPGSLRNVQLMAWLAKMIFGAQDFDCLPVAGVLGRTAVDEVKEGLCFLSEVRTRLHLLTGRRDDRLKFDMQRTIAEQMGFKDETDRRGVEGFMREYYRHAAGIDFFGRRILAKARLFLRQKDSEGTKRLRLDEAFHIGGGGIYHNDPENFGLDPKEQIQAFRLIARTGCDLDIRLVDLIRLRLREISEDFIGDPEANASFLELLQTRGFVAKALNSAMKVGFLEVFVPDFAWIRFRPQHDVYHQYTVDLHTIAVLENIDSFVNKTSGPDDSLLHTIAAKLERPEVLILAGLFHDIAKGRGAGHEVRGEQIARPFLERLGLPQDDIAEVCFLIRNHLAMTHLAFKKDLHDEQLIARFSENVMSTRRLDLLFLLTHADLRAVGPTAFNSWRRMLLEELYYRTLDVIEGESVDGEDLPEWVKQIKAVVTEMVPVELRDAELDKFLAGADSRYFLDYYPGIIAEHFVDYRKYLASRSRNEMEDGDLIARKTDHRKPGFSSITLVVKDKPGLFYHIAGTLTASRINILGAWSHSVNEIAIGTFHVNDIPEGPLDDPDRWDRFQDDFKKVLNGAANVDDLIEVRRKARRYGAGGYTPRFPLKVELDNAASDRALIIEVNAHDRPGLLYDITRKLSALNLDIVLAKITTEVDQAADIFYVVDTGGGKIVDRDRLDVIKSSLTEHLSAMEAEYATDQKDGVIVF